MGTKGIKRRRYKGKNRNKNGMEKGQPKQEEQEAYGLERREVAKETMNGNTKEYRRE